MGSSWSRFASLTPSRKGFAGLLTEQFACRHLPCVLRVAGYSIGVCGCELCKGKGRPELGWDGKLDTLWDSGADVATHHGPDGWIIEVRLPAAGENAKDIDAHNRIAGRRPSETYPWFVNVCRQRVRDEQTELTAWSPTGKSRFNVPKKFGKVHAK